MAMSTHVAKATPEPESDQTIQCLCGAKIKVFCVTNWLEMLRPICQDCMAKFNSAWDAHMQAPRGDSTPDLTPVIGEVITPEIRGAPWVEHEAVSPGTV